jgi:actin-related protein 5
VCETYFAPSMAGVDSAGLGEVIQNVLARFTEEEKGRLVKVTFSSPTVMVDTDFPS